MRRADPMHRCHLYSNINSKKEQQKNNKEIVPPFSNETSAKELENELEQLYLTLQTAAEFVFQQRLTLYRLNQDNNNNNNNKVLIVNEEETRAAQKQLIYLEDNLSQHANRHIRKANLTALYFLNEKQYSRALQILLNVETIVKKGAGSWFPFLVHNTEYILHTNNSNNNNNNNNIGFAQSIEGNQTTLSSLSLLLNNNNNNNNNNSSIQQIFIPFFTKRHERLRQLSEAIVLNNIGLYHFKISEYQLAAQRLSHALQLEEILQVETIGVTYFNLAQAQYEIGNISEAFNTIILAEEAIEKRIHTCQVQRNTLQRISQHCNAFIHNKEQQQQEEEEEEEEDADIEDHNNINNNSNNNNNNNNNKIKIPGLEKRILDVFVNWREGVCLIARVLETHGRWLQTNHAFKSAIIRYEQSIRYICLIKTHTSEEKIFKNEIQKKIQECKRALRHIACIPQFHNNSNNNNNNNNSNNNSLYSESYSNPKSIIVTTALPSRIEIDIEKPQIYCKKQQSTHQKNRLKACYRDVNGELYTMHNNNNNNMKEESMDDIKINTSIRRGNRCVSSSNGSIGSRGFTNNNNNNNNNINNNNNNNNINNNNNNNNSVPRSQRPPWDSSTYATHKYYEINKQKEHTRLTKTNKTNISIRRKRKEESTDIDSTSLVHSNNNNNNNKSTSRANTSSEQVNKPALFHNSQQNNTNTISKFLRRRNRNNIIESSTLLNNNNNNNMGRMLSFVQCIHILQAFARARISIIEREWKKRSQYIEEIVSSTSYYSSSCVTEDNINNNNNNNNTQDNSDTFKFYSGRSSSAETAPLLNDNINNNNNNNNNKSSSTTSFNLNEILLAFWSAFQSIQIVQQRRVEKQYNDIMKNVIINKRKDSDSSVKKKLSNLILQRHIIIEDKEKEKEMGSSSKILLSSNSSSTILASFTASSNGRSSKCIEEGVIEYSNNNNNNNINNNNINGLKISKDRLHRRYNSLLRVQSQINKTDSTTCSTPVNLKEQNNKDKLIHNSSLTPAIYSTENEIHLNHYDTPKISEDSLNHNGATDDHSGLYNNNNNYYYYYNNINGNISDKVKQNSSQKKRKNYNHNQDQHHMKFEEVLELEDQEYQEEIQIGLPPRYPITHKTSLSSLSFHRHSNIHVTNATREIIRQRIIREEAAIIIQHTWRQCRERRQSAAVRKLIYR